MPNFRLHKEKGHLLKKNKKRKMNQTSAQAKKKRKLSKTRSESITNIIDPKLFGDDIEGFSNDNLIIDSNAKKTKVKKKKKKKMSKKKRKKLESLRKKREDKQLYAKFCKEIEENKVKDDDVLIKSSQVGITLTSRQKLERLGKLQERNLDVPDSLKNELTRQRNKIKKRELSNEAENELYYFRNNSNEEEEGKEKEEEKIPSNDLPPPLLMPPPKIVFDFEEDSEEEIKNVVENNPKPETKKNTIKEEEENKKVDSLMSNIQVELSQPKESKDASGGFFNLQFNFDEINKNNMVDEEEDEEPRSNILPEIQERIHRLGTHKESDNTQAHLIKELQRQRMRESGIKPKKYFKLVQRNPQIETERSTLPILEKEQEIMEGVIENDVLIICGETGSGKTTQIPQFLYEGGFSFKETGFPGLIGITQPRRVAALSTSQRVSEEMGEGQVGSTVGVHIRYFKRYSTRKTKILYLTDGILLNEIQSDPLLLKYSVIILDEAHERNINTDILVGWISRILPYRNEKASEGLKDPNNRAITPLKLIIMSATLKVSDFTSNRRLFNPPPPVINIESRQYEVTVHFNKRTRSLGHGKESYVLECGEKILKIHDSFPRGDILVFLTGKDEINMLVKYLREKDKSIRKERKTFFHDLRKKEEIEGEGEEEDDEDDEEDNNDDKIDPNEKGFTSFEEEEKWINSMGDDILDPKEDEENEDEEETTKTVLFKSETKEEEEEEIKPPPEEKAKKKKKKNVRKRPVFMKILPLHSNLPPNQQLEIFRPTSQNTRKIVVSTNVAETSITIKGVRYVIDCGKAKYKHHFVNSPTSDEDENNNNNNNDLDLPSAPIIQYRVQWCSKSSANQRSGRAGRTCPGHCYRLYSAPVFQNFFSDFEVPEVLRAPMDSVVLRMKSLGIDYIQNFPFPSPPRMNLLRRAVRSLIHLKALRTLTLGERLAIRNNNNNNEGEIYEDSDFLTRITALGEKLNKYPLHPRLSKMLLFGIGLARKMGGPSLAQYVVLLVSVFSSTYPILLDNMPSKKNREKWFNGRKSDVLALFCLAGGCLIYEMNSNQQKMFCEEYGVSVKSIKEVSKLRFQLDLLLKKVEGLAWDFCPPKLPPPNEGIRLFLRQIISSGFADQYAELVVDEGEICRLLGKEKYMKLKKSKKAMKPIYTTFVLGDDFPVYIHPSSFYCEFSPSPRIVVYNELVRTKGNRICMSGITVVHRDWINKYGNLDWEN